MPSSPALLLLADGRFPAGGHAHSAGVEAAVRFGDVVDEATLERYLHARLATSGVTEAAFVAAAAATTAYRVLDEELAARTMSPRLREVGRRQGRQLLRAARAVWPAGDLAALDGCLQPVVLGAVAAVAGGTPAEAALVHLHHVAAAVTGAAVRLLALDPMGAAAVQARAAPLIAELVSPATTWAASAPADLPALGGLLSEILGEDHGSWPARLFVA